MGARMIQRRAFLTGLAALITAPAIVRAGSLMPVRSVVVEPIWTPYGIAPGMEEARRLINYRNSLMHKYIRANLFQPYLGDSINSGAPLAAPWQL